MPWQGADPHGGEVIKVRALMRGYGCVVTTAGIIANHQNGTHLSTLAILRILQAAPGCFVDADGHAPGDLLVWPVAAATLGLVAAGAVAHAPDHVDALHELGGHMVDPNADLAGVLAELLVYGGAAVRVDVDGDGMGDHTIACIGRDGAGFRCDDPATGAIITLDENLENASIEWRGVPKPYRAVGVRGISRRFAA